MRLLKTTMILACCGLVAAVAAMAGGTMLTVHKTPIGKVVANSAGLTLYIFRKDSHSPGHSKSACYGACASVWPPLLTSGTPVAGPGLVKSLLGTTKRTDGKLQVTYKGYPLYRYATDTKPGQTRGEGSKSFGAGWYALTPKGIQIDRD
jgi:predicted lipoprotein with Yx(FWY)xxD motif